MRRPAWWRADRVFAWSLLVLVALVAFLYAPRFGAFPGSGPSSHLLDDVAIERGCVFSHTNGATGARFMPETLGAGLAWLDYDVDGDPDLLFVDSGGWGPALRDPGAKRPGAGGGPGGAADRAGAGGTPVRCRLFRNDGGRFTDLSRSAGLSIPFYGMGVAVGDIDNDGDPDVYITGYPLNALFENAGGTFKEVTERSGVAAGGWSSSATFLDYDRDGLLDLFVVRYVDWTEATNRICYTGGVRSYCGPDEYAPLPDVLYRNEGGGLFEDVTARAGIADDGKGLGCVACDFDADIDTDIFVANDTTPNRLWWNRGDGTFREGAAVAGVAYGEDGKALAGMGVAVADTDGDGLPDIAVANFQREPNTLYRNLGGGLFLDASLRSGFGEPARYLLQFGIDLLPLRNLPAADAVSVGGHIFDNCAEVDQTATFAQRGLILLGDGEGGWRAMADPLVGPLSRPLVRRGLAHADMDGDGDLDLAVSSNGGPAELLANGGSNLPRSLRVQLVGRRSNRDGIGARVEAVAGGATRVAWRLGASAYLSQSEGIVHLGMGSVPRCDILRVRWPSGVVDEIRDVALPARVTVVEGEGLR